MTERKTYGLASGDCNTPQAEGRHAAAFEKSFAETQEQYDGRRKPPLHELTREGAGLFMQTYGRGTPPQLESPVYKYVKERRTVVRCCFAYGEI